MKKRDRVTYAIILIVLILALMGYIVYVRVAYAVVLEPGLGILATIMGYLLHEVIRGGGNHSNDNT